MGSGTRRLILDLAPTVALLALGSVLMATSYESAGYQGPRLANFALLVAVVLPLVGRRRFPAAVLGAVFIAQGVWVALYYHGSHQPPFEPFAAGVVACFALGYHARERELRIGIALFLIASRRRPSTSPWAARRSAMLSPHSSGGRARSPSAGA